MNALTVTIAVLCLLAAHAAEDCKDLCSAGAESCQTPEEASTCMPGYGLASDNKCVKCGSNPSAGTGASGKNAGGGKWWEPWNSGSCVECKANCETCGTKTTCTTCKNGYALLDGSCKACAVSQAANCDGDVTTATACNAGYTKQTDGKKCYTKCKANQFEVADAGTCTTCDANASKCTDKDTADACNSGYRKNGKKCEACTVPQASQCNDDVATATACNPKYELKTGGKACFLKCKPNQAIDATAGKCDTCDANASKCTDKDIAETCNSGYRVNTAKKCEACDTGNCDKCVTLKANCEICKAGYAKDCTACSYPWADAKCDVCDNSEASKKVSCVPCDANAATCTNQYQAAICKAGFQLADNGKCVSCDTLKDGQSKKTTEQDPKGVAPTTNWWMAAAVKRTCVSTLTGCETKMYKDDGTGWCKKCSQGAYWPHDASGNVLLKDAVPGVLGVAGTCKLIDTNCIDLFSAVKCTTCKAGYRATGALSAKKCEACTVPQASQCNDDVATATACNPKYELKTGGKACFLKCKPNQFIDAIAGKCDTCDANAAGCADKDTANACKSGYRLQAGKCEKCTVTNCHVCDTIKTSCTACQGKYAPNAAATTCALVCDAHATSCTDANTAASCDTAKNYHLANGRCVYCVVPIAPEGGLMPTKAGNKIFFDATTGRCGTCDLYASGCATIVTAAACEDKYTKNEDGHCVENCPAWHADLGGVGKCYSCGANVVGGYCASPGEGLRCNSGYHIKGAGQGYCCKDIAASNAAAGLVTSGALALASSFGALYMVM